MLLCNKIVAPRGGNKGLSVSQLLPVDKNTAADTVVRFLPGLLFQCCGPAAVLLQFVACLCSLFLCCGFRTAAGCRLYLLGREDMLGQVPQQTETSC